MKKLKFLFAIISSPWIALLLLPVMFVVIVVELVAQSYNKNMIDNQNERR